MRTRTYLGFTRSQADTLRKVSVWVNVCGFAFFVMGNVPSAAALKIVAEAMRLPFFEHVQARDMTCLGLFFITGSALAIFINRG